jgi:hypothetical protein
MYERDTRVEYSGRKIRSDETTWGKLDPDKALKLRGIFET